MREWTWIIMAAFGASTGGASAAPGKSEPPSELEMCRAVIECCKPLARPRGNRLPLYACPVRGVAPAGDPEAEQALRDLDARGIALFTRWNPAESQREASLAEALRIGKMQKRLGLAVSVDATRCFYQFCDGSPQTAHIDEKGEPFFDLSFSPTRKMGCPFALEGQWPRVRAQLECFGEAYKKEGLEPDMIWGDWEIDGPMEWNDAWANSKRCARCRQNIPNIEDFRSFQAALREVRATMQREVFVKTLKSYFPKALIGNYAEYPCGGARYWYDWFEKLPEGAPFIADRKARHRPWHEAFAQTGYTVAMPVIYTWSYIFSDYDFADTDYRWAYNMLQVASDAAKSRDEKAPGIPLTPFVHWTTTAHSPELIPPGLVDLSERGYREVLWHTLLRGADTLIMWCRADLEQIRKEMRPVHEVWAASLEYADFLEKGKPIAFNVPADPADVISGLALGDKVLVRRSHFGAAAAAAVSIVFEGKTIRIPAFTDECRVLGFE